MPAFTQHSPNDGLNFFEVPPSSANKKGDANLMGNFDDKHGDLIWFVFYDEDTKIIIFLINFVNFAFMLTKNQSFT